MRYWKKREKINKFLKGFTTLTEAIMNGDKGIVDLQKYITENGDIELEPIESQKIMGIVKLILSHFEDLELGSERPLCHAQPKDLRSEEVGENEKEQESNNKYVECNKEFGSIEELRVHEKNCNICEQCNN